MAMIQTPGNSKEQVSGRYQTIIDFLHTVQTVSHLLLQIYANDFFAAQMLSFALCKYTSEGPHVDGSIIPQLVAGLNFHHILHTRIRNLTGIRVYVYLLCKKIVPQKPLPKGRKLT